MNQDTTIDSVIGKAPKSKYNIKEKLKNIGLPFLKTFLYAPDAYALLICGGIELSKGNGRNAAILGFFGVKEYVTEIAAYYFVKSDAENNSGITPKNLFKRHPITMPCMLFGNYFGLLEYKLTYKKNLKEQSR